MSIFHANLNTTETAPKIYFCSRLSSSYNLLLYPWLTRINRHPVLP